MAGQMGRDLDSAVSEGHSEEMIFEMRPDDQVEASCGKI